MRKFKKDLNQFINQQKTKTMKKTLFALLLIFAFTKSEAQFKISNLDYLSKIKDGTTYVAMKNPDAPVVKDYIDVFKKYWTFSKVEFIKYSDIQKKVSSESSFFEIGGFEVSAQGAYITSTNTHIYLKLWACSDKFLKNKNKKLSDMDKIEIARIELYTDFSSLYSPKILMSSDYDGGGHIRNWGPGFLKNYIQDLMTLLDANKERSLFSGVSDVKTIKELKNQTLFVPDYVLIKFNKMTGDESSRQDEKNIMSDYKYKYEILTTEALNKKIMTEKDPFYYLVYVKSSTDKFVSIFNSQTGEMIYSSYSPMSYNFGSKDMKDISSKIGPK
jgi:hypothetical protein